MNQEFFLDTDAPNQGMYLSQQQIDLLFIVSCNTKEQLEYYFYNMCGQFPYQRIESVIPNYETLELEEAKRALFSKYQDILVGYQENHRMTLEQQARIKLEMMRTPNGEPLDEEIKTTIITLVKSKGIDAGIKYLKDTYGNDFCVRFNRLMKDDFENIKSINYEDVESLHERIKNDPRIDTIIIATSKYDNTVFSNGEGTYYDPYLTSKGLAYCKSTGKIMRFHALFDFAHLQKLVEEGKGPQDKEEILRDMKSFVHISLEYIENYNNSIKGTNHPPICIVEIFNELVEYNKQDSLPYEMAWEKYFGITIDDILSCFEGVKKPDGVEFMYNETLLEEHPDRRRKVDEVLSEIMAKRPDLIDVFGNQMHLQHTHAEETSHNQNESIESVRDSLRLMSDIESREYHLPNGGTKKLRTEITEFDIHICKETYLGKVIPMINKGELTLDDIALLRKSWIQKLSEEIRKSGIKLDRITYWSIHDTVDHNLVRANKEILDNNPNKSIEELKKEGTLVNSLHAGVLGGTIIPPPKKQIKVIEEPSHDSPKEEQPQNIDELEKPKVLAKKPNTIPNSGFITEYIILGIILAILLTLVILTIGTLV